MTKGEPNRQSDHSCATSCLLAPSASNSALKPWLHYCSGTLKDDFAARLSYFIMLGWAFEEPGSILNVANSMSLVREGAKLSETVALLENSRRQRRKSPTAVNAYFLKNACGRGASTIMHCFSKVLRRAHQAPRRPAVKLNTCTQRKGCLQIVWHFSPWGTDSLQSTQMHSLAQEDSLTCLPRRSCSASF